MVDGSQHRYNAVAARRANERIGIVARAGYGIATPVVYHTSGIKQGGHYRRNYCEVELLQTIAAIGGHQRIVIHPGAGIGVAAPIKRSAGGYGGIWSHRAVDGELQVNYTVAGIGTKQSVVVIARSAEGFAKKRVGRAHCRIDQHRIAAIGNAAKPHVVRSVGNQGIARLKLKIGREVKNARIVHIVALIGMYAKAIIVAGAPYPLGPHKVAIGIEFVQVAIVKVGGRC